MNDVDVSCIICLELAIDAYDTECCHVIICSKCNDLINKCPYCQKSLNALRHKNIPISRIAKQISDSAKRKKEDIELVINTTSEYIKQIWNNIEKGELNLTNIKSLYSVIKVTNCQKIDVIENLVTKLLCDNIKKDLLFDKITNTKFHVDFFFMKQLMYDFIKYIEVFQSDAGIYFDKDDMSAIISYDNVLARLIYETTEMVCHNIIKMISCLLCDVTLEPFLFDLIIKTLIVSKKYGSSLISISNVLDVLIDKMVEFINIVCLNYAKIDYVAFSLHLTKICNELNHEHSLNPLTDIIKTRYINDINRSIDHSIHLLNIYPIKSENKDMNIFIATAGHWKTNNELSHWKTNNEFKGNIPGQFIEQCNMFEAFYKSVYTNNRKIIWRLEYGTAEIEIVFNEKCTRTIICTTCQMMILLLFNKKTILSFEDILKLTGIGEVALTDHLLTLCCRSVRILKKKPNIKYLSLTDKFLINTKYDGSDDPYFVPKFKFNEQKQKHRHDTALKHRIESKIVCIAMSRRNIKYNIMVAEILMQVSESYLCVIRNCIENLISQEYLELQVKDDVKYLHYLA